MNLPAIDTLPREYRVLVYEFGLEPVLSCRRRKMTATEARHRLTSDREKAYARRQAAPER